MRICKDLSLWNFARGFVIARFGNAESKQSIPIVILSETKNLKTKSGFLDISPYGSI